MSEILCTVTQPAPTGPVGQPALPVFDVLDRIPVGLLVVDRHLTVIGWNQTLADWTGISATEICGTCLTDRLPHLAAPRYSSRIRNVLSTGAPAVLSAALHRNFIPAPACEGAHDRLMVQETRIQRVSVDPPQALISIQNLTTEYHQLESLRAERAELNGIRKELIAANASLHDSLRLLEQNNELLQREVRVKNSIEAELRRHAADLEASRSREREHIARLEQLVDELTQARRSAEAAAQSKGEFLANMSHEIRTPMTAILGFVDLLRDAETSAAERVVAIDTIHRNGQHLLTLINDILDLSKIEAGCLIVEQLDCRPRDVVTEVLSLLESRAQSRGLTLAAHFSSDSSIGVRTDPVRLRQILMNLVGNAIKFTDHGRIDVIASEQPASVPRHVQLEIQVRDTGIGITPLQMTHLFQAFSQADTTTTRRFGGTGLGLTISRKLAHALGGDLTVSSEPGSGSCFSLKLTLPAADSRVSDPRESRVTQSATVLPSGAVLARPALPSKLVTGPLTGLHLLIVDDAPDNQRLLAHHLRRCGATFEVLENGVAAVNRLLHQPDGGPVDLVLLDMQMPIMDGYTAAAEPRAGGCQLPLVAITAHAMASDREKCLAHGCSDYLTKPVDKPRLLETILRWVPPAPTNCDAQSAAHTV